MLTTLKGSTLKEVGGSFDCSDNLITTLEGLPQKIGASFNCSRNELTSLKGAPEVVDGSFSCLYNRLTSLEGSPRIIKGYLNCKNNPIATLKGAPLEISTYFLCSSAFSSEYVDVKWDMKGWLEGLNQEPSLFAPFLLAKTGDIDDKYLTPEVMYLIRKNAPEVFDILAKRMGDGASTLADLGEVGF
jgi:hypothetical protein